MDERSYVELFGALDEPGRMYYAVVSNSSAPDPEGGAMTKYWGLLTAAMQEAAENADGAFGQGLSPFHSRTRMRTHAFNVMMCTRHART